MKKIRNPLPLKRSLEVKGEVKYRQKEVKIVKAKILTWTKSASLKKCEITLPTDRTPCETCFNEQRERHKASHEKIWSRRQQGHRHYYDRI